jgi:hypothetical protein
MLNNIYSKRFIKALIILTFSLFTFHFSLLTCYAHKFHTTLARIDYNEKEKTAEIYVQVFTEDLLATLTKLNNKNIDLQKTKNIDELIFAYLKDKFVIKDSEDKSKELVWVGKEIENDSVYIYFQVEKIETIDKFQLKNSMFFEFYPEQSNLIICKSNDKKADLAFKVGDNFKEIILNNSDK